MPDNKKVRRYSVISFLLAAFCWASEDTEYHAPVPKKEEVARAIIPPKKHYDEKLLADTLEKYHNPSSTPDKSCLIYSRSYRSDPIPKGYLEMQASLFMELLCNTDTKKRIFEPRKSLKGKFSDFFTSIKSMFKRPPSAKNLSSDGEKQLANELQLTFTGQRAPSSTEFYSDLKENFNLAQSIINDDLPQSEKNLALTFAGLTPLGIDETAAYPLAKMHTNAKSGRAEWEAGLYHLSASSLYADNAEDKPRGSNKKGQLTYSNDLKSVFYRYLDQMHSFSLRSSEEAALGISQLCGLTEINEKYFEDLRKLHSKRNKESVTNAFFTNLAGNDFSYDRDFSAKTVMNIFRKVFSSEKESKNLLDFLKESTQDAPANHVNDKLLEKRQDKFSIGFIDTFRKLHYYCPKFATEFTAYSIRNNAKHQGSIKREALYPHCLKFYLELTQQKAKACKY